MPPLVWLGFDPAWLLAGEDEYGTVKGLYCPLALPVEMPCQPRITPRTPAFVALVDVRRREDRRGRVGQIEELSQY